MHGGPPTKFKILYPRPWPTVPCTPTLPTVTKPPPPPPFRRRHPCAAVDPPHLWWPASAHRSVPPLIVARLPWPPLPASAPPVARPPPTVPVLVRLRTSPDAASTYSSLGRLLRLLVARSPALLLVTKPPRHVARPPPPLDTSPGRLCPSTCHSLYRPDGVAHCSASSPIFQVGATDCPSTCHLTTLGHHCPARRHPGPSPTTAWMTQATSTWLGATHATSAPQGAAATGLL
jgi:hypothetical protein